MQYFENLTEIFSLKNFNRCKKYKGLFETWLNTCIQKVFAIKCPTTSENLPSFFLHNMLFCQFYIFCQLSAEENPVWKSRLHLNYEALNRFHLGC